MTLLERIEWIKENMRIKKILIQEDEFEELENILGKADAKEPASDEVGNFQCPVCRSYIGAEIKGYRFGLPYCAQCGQKIRWED